MPGCIVLLCGLPGAGKSTLAAAMMRELEDENSVASKVFAERLGLKAEAVYVSFDDIQEDVANTLRKGASHLGHSHEGVGGDNQSSVTMVPAATDDFDLKAWKDSRLLARQQVIESLKGGDALVLVDDNLYYGSMRYSFCQVAREFRVGIITIKVECTLEEAKVRNSNRSTSRRVPEEIISRMAERFEDFASWEKHAVTLQAADQLPWDEIASAWLDPRLEADEAEKASIIAAEDRQRNAENFLHLVDIVLRKAVAEWMRQCQEQGKDKKQLQSISKNCACHRKELLQELRSFLSNACGEHKGCELCWIDPAVDAQQASYKVCQEFRRRMSISQGRRVAESLLD